MSSHDTIRYWSCDSTKCKFINCPRHGDTKKVAKGIGWMRNTNALCSGGDSIFSFSLHLLLFFIAKNDETIATRPSAKWYDCPYTAFVILGHYSPKFLRLQFPSNRNIVMLRNHSHTTESLPTGERIINLKQKYNYLMKDFQIRKTMLITIIIYFTQLILYS